MHLAVHAEERAGGADRGLGEGHEIGVGTEPVKRLVPDVSEHVPRRPADGHGGEVEGVIRDPRVDVHASVVVRRLDVVAHVRRLWIAAEDRVVVGRARSLHRADAFPVHRGAEEALADDPVGRFRRETERGLLDHDPERV